MCRRMAINMKVSGTNNIGIAAKEHWLPAIVFLAGITVTMSAFFTIKGELDSHRQAEFSWEAHNRNNALKKGIEDGLESVKAVRDLFQASEHVTQPEFRYFARALLARYRGIHALEWVSPVRHGFATADKSAEAADAGLVASHGIEFRITYIEPIRHDG